MPRVVQEESATEVVHSLARLRQKLVGDKGNVIACLAEHSREKRIVAPLTLVAYGVERENMLEDKARKIPRTHYVGIFHKSALLLKLLLAWRSRHAVAILCRVMAVVALAYDKHDIWRAERTRVDLHLVYSRHQTVNLLCCERIGIKAEHQTVDRLVKVGMTLLRQRMFYNTDSTARHQLDKGSLVVRA